MAGSAPCAPIFVVGFPRSGTTLLQALIGAHPRIAGAPELHYVRRIWPFAKAWGDLADDSALRRVITETVRPPTGHLDPADFDVDRIFERARHGPRTHAGVLDATLSEFAARHGKKRWSEKSPRQAARAAWALFPDAQVVHIVRDPRETVVSAATKLGRYPDVVAAAREWREFTLNDIEAGHRRGPANYLRIRYEDLAREPEAVMTVVFAFLGETWDPGILTDLGRRAATVPEGGRPWMGEALQAVRPPSAAGWETTVSSRRRARVLALVADLMPGLGYGAARRRLVLTGRLLNAVAAPGLRLHAARQQRRLKRLRTPEQRYQYAIEEQQRIVEAGLGKVSGGVDR